MKRKLLLISLALVLTLTVLTPAAALAAKPQSFYASGQITYISPGNVAPAGESGRWRVIERELRGELLAEMSGLPTDISGPFIMTYQANVELETQAGNLHGILNVGEYSFRVNGKVQPLEYVSIAPGIELPKLTITGHWTFDGERGQGDFDAWAIFIPDPDGHIETFFGNCFTMTGKW
jgi:hypothetical protein